MKLSPAPLRRRRGALTPMIDVVFLLLLYFMLVAHYQDLRVIHLDTPTVSGESAADDVVRIDVLDGGIVQLNGANVSLTELDAHLRAALDRNPDQSVWVRPASAAPLQQWVSVMDRLQALGVRYLRLLRDEAAGP